MNRMKYKPKVKLLTWWVADIEWNDKDYCISQGIWETISVEEKLDGSRKYTLKCLFPSSSERKVGDLVIMDERNIIEFCSKILLKRIKYKSIYDRKL